jgi:AcrR family transcriptional regulator
VGDTDSRPSGKRGLTRDLLVGTALRIADTEGLEAVSMRRLGAELGVDASAAYRHLPGKKDLLAGIVEAVLAQSDVETDPASPWPEQFRQVARAYRAGMLAHSPAVARLVATTPFNTLASLRIVEHGVAVLIAAGIPVEQAVFAIQAVGQLATGAVMLEAFWRQHAAAGGEVFLFPPMLPDPALPALSTAVAAGAFRPPGDVFEAGLDAILASIGARADHTT